jgi:protein involved in polysaccharide export with SLBB domain
MDQIMNRYILLLVVMLSIVSCTTLPENKPDQLSGFVHTNREADLPGHAMTLGAGDEIVVNVWRNTELQRTVKIDLDGNIFLPLAGQVHAADLTINELRDRLVEKYARYLVDPQIDINPNTLSSKRYIVLGEVKNPGTYQLTAEIDLIGAIASAGGATSNANDDLLLFRRSEGVVRVLVAKANIKEIAEENFASANVKIFNRDIIYVPTSTIADVDIFMQRISRIIAPLLEVQRGVILWPDFTDVFNNSNKTKGSNIVVP